MLKKGASSAIKLINEIDHKIFQEKLINLGIQLSKDNYNILIDTIKKRLNSLVAAKDEVVNYLEPQKYFSTLSPDIIRGKKLIFINYDKKQYKICSFNLDHCEN